jgi:hypothetical protein
MQGTFEEKCKISKKLNIPNIELEIKNKDKEPNYKKIFTMYEDNIIFNLPLLNYDLSNLNDVENILIKLLVYNVNSVIIKAYNLNINEYEWSTEKEKNNYIQKMASGIAKLASNKIVILVENHTFAQEKGFFGQDINQISDLLVYSRKILIDEYKFTEKDANKYIKICLNVNNAIKNSNDNNIDKWIEVFNNYIGAIKISDNSKYEKILNEVLDKCIKNKIDCPILIGEKVDLDELKNKYITLVNIIDIYNQNNNIKVSDKKKIDKQIAKVSKEKDYSNYIVAGIIIITIFIAILMVYVKFNS